LEKSEYQKYLASREWSLKKRAVKERAGGKCERCKFGEYQQTHHLTYEHIGAEPLEDLQGICSYCHKFISAESNIDPIEESHVLEYLEIYAKNAEDSEEAKYIRKKLSHTTLYPFQEEMLVFIYVMGIYPDYFIKYFKETGSNYDLLKIIQSINQK
jgi:hypothetical protein